MGRRLRSLFLASAFLFPAQSGFGQADVESAKIPQPHLAKARADAFGENGWKFPALITCYPDEGQSAERVIKDPGPGKAADNFYFLGTGIVAAWAVNTSDGIILIDTLNNQADAEKYIEGGLRHMGLDPARIQYLRLAGGEQNLSEALIPQKGERIASVATNFAVLPELEGLRLSR